MTSKDAIIPNNNKGGKIDLSFNIISNVGNINLNNSHFSLLNILYPQQLIHLN